MFPTKKKQAKCSSIQEYIDLATINVHVKINHKQQAVGVIVVVNVVVEGSCLHWWLLRVRLACMSG